MEQITQMTEKNKESLESDSKKENILHILTRVRDMHLDEKGEYLQKEEVSGCSKEGVCFVSESESYGITTYTRQCEITSVYGSFVKQDEKCNVLIQSLGCRAIQSSGFSPRKKASINNSDTMTIHYYMSNVSDERLGQPVVLNFTGTKRFLKCTYENGKALLTAEYIEQDQLKSISKNDETTWPFVFFLSKTKDNLHRFESATCGGWFIRRGSRLVYACNRLEEKIEENTFQFFPWKN